MGEDERELRTDHDTGPLEGGRYARSGPLKRGSAVVLGSVAFSCDCGGGFVADNARVPQRFRGKLFLMLVLWSLILVYGTIFAMFQDRGTVAYTWFLLVFPVAKALSEANEVFGNSFVVLMVAKMVGYSGIAAYRWRRPWLVYVGLAAMHIGLVFVLFWNRAESPH